jgi:hypothetical protein
LGEIHSGENLSAQAKAPIPSKPWTELGCRPEDLIFLTACALRGDLASVVNWARTAQDAAQVVEMLASRHRAGPFLAARLKDSAAWEALPKAARERLNKSADLQAAAARDCLAHLAELQGILGNAGCRHLVLKGPELGMRFFGGADARGYRDVDVLVEEQDREKACSALEKAGYHRLSRWLLGGGISSRFNHAVDYRKADRLLDLHWCVSRAPGVGIETHALFVRSVSVEIGAQVFQVLSPEDELSVLLISTFADIQRGYLRLQSFIDIAQVMKFLPETGWSAFLQRQSSQRTEGMSRAVLALVISLFELEPLHPALLDSLGALPSKKDAMSVLLPSPGGRLAKRWSLPHLPVDPLHYSIWWLTSLPFRVAASHPRFRRPVPIGKDSR